MMRCYTEAASSHYKMIKAGSPMKMSGGLVAKVLDSQSRDPVFKTTGWLQGRLSLSSFQGR